MAGDNVHLFTQFEDFNEIYQITNDTGSKDFIHICYRKYAVIPLSHVNKLFCTLVSSRIL